MLSVTPYYNKPNRRGIVRHFEEVARAAGGTPVILYNIPGRTAVNMPPDLLAELGADRRHRGGQAGQLRPSCSRSTGSPSSPATTTSSLACLDLGRRGRHLRRLAHRRAARCAACSTSPSARAEIDASLRDVYETLFLTASPTPHRRRRSTSSATTSATLRLPMVEADEAETAAVRAMLERHGLLGRRDRGPPVPPLERNPARPSRSGASARSART